jgi:hypothetical protein
MFMTRFPFGSTRKVQDARGISRAVPVAVRFAWESFSRRQRWGLLASAVFVGFCLFGFAYNLNFSIRNPPPYATGLLRWLGPSVWLFISAVQVANVWSVLTRAKDAPETATALMACGLCPACVYPISSLPIDNDGCTICPECGAAWRLANRM